MSVEDKQNRASLEMRYFTKKLLKFVVIFIVLNTVISTLVFKQKDSYLKSSSKLYKQKYYYLKKNIDKYDTVFLGSSKILRAINTKVFDEITERKSFNFGVYNILMPETVNYLEQSLESIKAGKVKTVFIELMMYATVSKGYKNQFKYLNGFMLSELEYIIFKSPYFNSDHLFQSLYAAFKKLTNAIRVLGMDIEPEIQYKPLKYNHGFMSFTNKFGEFKDHARRISFLKTKKIKKPFGISKVKKPFYSLGDSRFKKVIEKYEKEGIEVIFLIHPGNLSKRITDPHNTFLKSRKDIPIIDLSDIKKYSYLYNPELYFDRAHFIKEGADILTTTVAREFLELNTKKGAE